MKLIKNRSKALLKLLISIAAIQFSLTGFAAHIPESDIAEPMSTVEEHDEEHYPNWSVILKEGNIDSFTSGLLDVVKCLHLENEKGQSVQEATGRTSCQKRAQHFISHKNTQGDSLLKQFLLLGNLKDEQLVNTLALFEYIGVDIYGFKSANGDSALFHAIEKQNLDFIAYLLASVRKDHPESNALLPGMRSIDGKSLANALLKKHPNVARTAVIITYYGLAPDLSELDESDSAAYLALKYSRIEL